MNLRLVLAWLLAVPMFLLLLLFVVLIMCAVSLLAVYGPDAGHVFFVTGSFVYLFCAHLLYFGSYFAWPPLYQSRLGFVRRVLHAQTTLVVCSVLYVVSAVHILHYFRII